MAGLNNVSPCKPLYTPRSIDSFLKGRYMQLAKPGLQTQTKALRWKRQRGPKR